MSSSPHPVSWGALLFATVALVASLLSMMDSPRYGYTDVPRLLEAYPAAIAVKESIDRDLAPARSKIEQQQQLVEGVQNRIEQNRAQLSSTDLAVLDIQLLKARQQQSALQQQLSELEAKLRQERMTPVLGQLDEQLQELGKQEGFEMIWTATSSGNLVFASAAADVTDDLLAWLNTRPS